MKKILLLISFSLFPVLLWAMGGNKDSANDIPLPEKNYSVIITDTQNVQTTASRVSWEGKIYFQGRRGDALATIPFEKIAQIDVNPNAVAPPGSIATKVTLKSGEAIQLYVKATSKTYGETSFGKFEIYLRDLQKIIFN
ncbi:MAG: hypothetical protein QNL04_02470 [SAR324 cluster bacterium]|nr:hypothetical protein [SAR324 cluster bacterium]